MDPDQDPILLWSGKRNRREIPVLPLQRNEIVSESRIAQIIERVKRSAAEPVGFAHQSHLFSDLEKSTREHEKTQRVEFYTHDEGWKNKLVCGDSLQTVESLLYYENLRGKAHMIYVDPPYAIDYDSNFQQRIDSTSNADADRGDDILTIKAFRDTWTLGVHSYLSHLYERFYLCRELLADGGSVFVQMGTDNAHLVKAVLDEVFGQKNRIADIQFIKASGRGSEFLDNLFDTLLWYANDREALKGRYRQLYVPKADFTDDPLYKYVEVEDGSVVTLSVAQLRGDEPVPAGRRFRSDPMVSEGSSDEGSEPFEFEGRSFSPPPGTHWKLKKEGREALARKGRLFALGRQLRYKRYPEDFDWRRLSNIWTDTQKGTFEGKRRYVVQTAQKVVERCIAMSTRPGDLVIDITSGSGTTGIAAEKLGRRWILCDSSRVAINVARSQLLELSFPAHRLKGQRVADDFQYESARRLQPSDVAYDREAGSIELFDRPLSDSGVIRVCGPFEVMSVGRYSVDDWKGYIRDGPALANYVEVIARLYRRDAAIQGAAGLVHALAESADGPIGISIGPIAGRVTGKQINDAVQDALSSGVLEVHVLGWAFEANVGEVKSQLERRGKVKIELVVIRPDTLTEGLKATQPEMLFSPLALPDIKVEVAGSSEQKAEAVVSLLGVAVFDRRSRATDYKAAGSGYVSAWYLDEDYDGDCFVDCQMFFDFKKLPNLKAALRVEIEPAEFKLQTVSQPFAVRGYKRIAVKVVDVFGNESTVVKDLA
jgi:adenine-specific DNA-methyltransferase